MRLNGTVNIERDDNANYVVTYAPIGVDHVGRPQRRFKGWSTSSPSSRGRCTSARRKSAAR